MKSDRISRRTFLQATLASACALTAASAASAAVTLKGLQIVVPAPPGSQPDVIARWLIDPLARRAGVAGVVLNVPGAAGALAADAVLRAAPESGALLLGGLDHVAYSHLNSNRRALDPFTDFVPVAAVNRDTWVVAVSSESSARSLRALADRSRREPLNYASTGEGSTAHLLSARLCKALGIDAQHVPYREPWMPDLIAGRIHFVVAPTPALLPQLRAGRLMAVATLTDERLALPGEPPTIWELGTADQVFYGGLFLFGPASLAPLALQLNAWFRETVATADMLQRYRDASIEATPLDLDATVALLRQRLQTVDAMRLAVFGRSR
ncbi:tripartite tricarboxylate transporter substrate binding protein [Aquincola sp. J276]|uniref:tripartite tricarboxylate transporter substrate binding protein n=1 Tax=Aquincola sp. J276 TaxID=2898432 RepID=UPI002151F798|nr:tripartite tricarboxylate transporter substrate binding protein [Aquincola sp. J276]MCR5864029.1 tripartite tricarboxylate transporter substrate binding protein [Aquincola sp. J276]